MSAKSHTQLSNSTELIVLVSAIYEKETGAWEQTCIRNLFSIYFKLEKLSHLTLSEVHDLKNSDKFYIASIL